MGENEMGAAKRRFRYNTHCKLSAVIISF